jgi:hypothetical protein
MGMWAAINFSGAVNLLGLALTALGTYLTFKGNRAIKTARVIASNARQNVLLQMAASEIGSLGNQVAMLRVRVVSGNWEVSQHISSEVTARLHEAKGAFIQIRGLNRDLLDVAARSASELNEYLTSSGDGEDEKSQRLQLSCDYLCVLLHDIYGTLKMKEHEVTVL